MFLKTKKQIFELIDTVSEMIGFLCQLNNPISAISDCLAAVDSILSKLNKEEIVPKKTIDQLQNIKTSFYAFFNEVTIIDEKSVEMLENQVVLFKDIFEKEVNTKLNVVFFPYKASMWDSLATVYEASAKDENCVAKVVPIPYYQLSENGAISTYEGEHFPQNVPIIHYSKYSLEEEQPDIIFVHNIYDECNTLTRVYEEYFTTNLKNYTDMLVYVPYHVSSFITPQEGSRSVAYNVPSINNVDKVILVGDFLKKAAIRDGIPAEKLLVMGSPKLDAMINAMKEEISCPEGWKEKLQGKTVYLLNTGCFFWASQTFSKLSILTDLFNITRFVENSVLIWRPHPLTEITIKKYTPHFYSYYHTLTEGLKRGDYVPLNGVIFDETVDYLPALHASDVLVSTDGSLLRSYLITEKKVLFFDKEMPKGSLIPSDAFYYFYNEDEPWYELVKKFSKGYDPLAENRKGMAAKVYANTDGTCGEKVYLAIKDCVFKRR